MGQDWILNQALATKLPLKILEKEDEKIASAGTPDNSLLSALGHTGENTIHKPLATSTLLGDVIRTQILVDVIRRIRGYGPTHVHVGHTLHPW